MEISDESRFSLLHDGTLMIEDAQGDDQGVYECIARNVAGETHSNQVELRYFGERGKSMLVWLMGAILLLLLCSTVVS